VLVLYRILVPNDSRHCKSDYGAEWEGNDVPHQPPALSLSRPRHRIAGGRSLCPRRCFLGVLGQRGLQQCGCKERGLKYQISFWCSAGSILSGCRSWGGYWTPWGVKSSSLWAGCCPKPQINVCWNTWLTSSISAGSSAVPDPRVSVPRGCEALLASRCRRCQVVNIIKGNQGLF